MLLKKKPVYKKHLVNILSTQRKSCNEIVDIINFKITR